MSGGEGDAPANGALRQANCPMFPGLNAAPGTQAFSVTGVFTAFVSRLPVAANIVAREEAGYSPLAAIDVPKRGPPSLLA